MRMVADARGVDPVARDPILAFDLGDRMPSLAKTREGSADRMLQPADFRAQFNDGRSLRSLQHANQQRLFRTTARRDGRRRGTPVFDAVQERECGRLFIGDRKRRPFTAFASRWLNR